MTLLWAAGIHLLQWLIAFLALDCVFRTADLTPAGLRRRLGRYRIRFAILAAGCALAGGTAQVWLVGPWGSAPALAGWVPWWLLWRFGWRKHFTWLFKPDGGESPQ